jgi:hypothetical protein
METTKEKHATFTPGPWVISSVLKHGARCYRTIRQEGKFKLAEVFAFNECATGTEEGKAEDHANARLIAAAPELFEQCKLFEKVLKAIGDMGYKDEIDLDSHSWLMRTMELREVLAKVDGGEG